MWLVKQISIPWAIKIEERPQASARNSRTLETRKGKVMDYALQPLERVQFCWPWFQPSETDFGFQAPKLLRKFSYVVLSHEAWSNGLQSIQMPKFVFFEKNIHRIVKSQTRHLKKYWEQIKKNITIDIIDTNIWDHGQNLLINLKF